MWISPNLFDTRFSSSPLPFVARHSLLYSRQVRRTLTVYLYNAEPSVAEVGLEKTNRPQSPQEAPKRRK